MKRTAIVLGIVSILAAFFWNELNISSYKIHSLLLSHGRTVITADDASYIAPAENWVKGREFRNNLVGDFSYYMRPPGYSLVYSLFRAGLMTKHALYCIKYFQVFLFGLSISLLFLLFVENGIKKNLSILLCSFYGLGGIGIGFLYYTLTEAITPSLLIILFYLLFKAKNMSKTSRKTTYYLLCFTIFGFLFITRPVLGVFALPIPLFILWDNLLNTNKRLFYLFTFLFLGFGPMIIWQIRGYNISNEYIGLHPIYSTENKQTPYRPVHKAFWEFAKSWGETGENFHSYADEFWEKNYMNPTDTNSVNLILQKIPKAVKEEIGENKLRTTFEYYRLAIIDQKRHFSETIEIPKDNFENENIAIAGFEKLTSQYRQNHLLFYHIIAPIKVWSKMIFHSNLSLHLFQKTWRGNMFMELWRGLNYVFHSLVFILLPLVFFFKNISKEMKLVVFSTLLYLFYLAYFQRGIEERYTLPILPLAILTFGILFQKLLKKVGWE